MKKIYKLSAAVISLVVLLSALFAFPVFAANLNYSVAGASGEQGSTVTVSLKASSTVGIMSGQVSVKYDSSKLQFISGSSGGLFEIASAVNNGSSVLCTGMNTNDANAKKSGTFVTIKFKVLASSGDVPLTLSPSPDAGDHLTTNLGKLTPVVSNGKITVTKPVSGIALDKSSVTLKKGETASLTATVSPSDATDKTVTYTSSNAKVATVSSNGKITAVGGGTATVTAKAGGKTAACKVTVTVAQTGIKPSGNGTKTVELGASAKLSLVKVPADATDNFPVSWSSADSSIASVSSNGTVTGAALGETVITAVSNGWKAEFKVTVTEKTEEPTEPTETEPSASEPSEPEESEPEELPSEEAPVEDTKTVSKIYCYGLVALSCIATAVVSVLVTYYVTAAHYKKKSVNTLVEKTRTEDEE